MHKLRKYGKKPFNVVVIHGGPGAPGGMAPVARELSDKYGVLEPLQTADSIDGQIHELKEAIKEIGEVPVILIGHSWGAWLSYMLTTKHPELVKKLIIIGSGSFEQEYVAGMNEKRSNRLTEEENERVSVLIESLNDPNVKDKGEIFKEFGKLMTKADSYNPISLENEMIEFQPNIFESIMNEVIKMRKSGELLRIGSKVECEVVAIHGDYDSHSYLGVEKPLSKVLRDFRFILLDKCGHEPWNEINCKNNFYDILNQELR